MYAGVHWCIHKKEKGLEREREGQRERERKRERERERERNKNKEREIERNKAGYTATLVTCRWAGAVIEKDTKQ